MAPSAFCVRMGFQESVFGRISVSFTDQFDENGHFRLQKSGQYLISVDNCTLRNTVSVFWGSGMRRKATIHRFLGVFPDKRKKPVFSGKRLEKTSKWHTWGSVVCA